MNNSKRIESAEILKAKSKDLHKSVRISLTLSIGAWDEIERLKSMLGMKQREVFEKSFSLFSKLDYAHVVAEKEGVADAQLKKTVVVSELFNRFLGREAEKAGRSKNEIVSFMVHLLFEIEKGIKEGIMEKAKRTVAILSKVEEEMDRADRQLREIWGDEEWDNLNDRASCGFGLGESTVIVNNLIGDLEAMVRKVER